MKTHQQKTRLGLRALLASSLFLTALALLVATSALSIESPPEELSKLAGPDVKKSTLVDVHESSVRLRAVSCGEDTIQLGSGSIIDDDWILTARHVVEESPYIEIEKWDGEKLIVSDEIYVPEDRNMDVAWLKLEEKQKSFLEVEKTSPELNTEISIVGYPNGDSLDERNGFIVERSSGNKNRVFRDQPREQTERFRSFSESGVPLSFEASVTIVDGSSGSPVLNEGNKIVGVAVSYSKGQLRTTFVNGAAVAEAFDSKVLDKKCDPQK